MDALTAARARDFYAWRAGEPQERVGSGKYGRVYGSGRTSVLKESVTRAGLCKQAFREHVMGLLQTLLVLQSCTPHLPVHYGAAIAAGGSRMRGYMYMERFEGSLLDFGARLCTEMDWLSLLFQLFVTLVALALLFGVTHNDAYPRNILINSRARAPRVVYRVQEKSYALPWSFMAALTDFGIASTPVLMGNRSAPEVSERLKALEPPRDLASTAPRHHVLAYKSLPVFSRDAYTVLQWTCFAHRGLPAAPPAVRLWARSSLQLLDEIRESLEEAAGLARFFHAIFASGWLATCGLPALEVDEAGGADFMVPADGARLLAQAADALLTIPLSQLRSGLA